MLKVNQINVFYDGLHVLKDVSLEIDEKEMVAVLGSNGAGKSTLLKTIMGLLRSRSGNIEFLNERIDKLPTHRIIEMGIVMVPEGGKVFPELTVRENLELSAYTKRARKKIAESLERIYQLFPILKEREKQLGGTLSGGERQMLSIARGLMAKPKLLMVDEPSLGLAPKLVIEVFKCLENIHNEGTPILLVEQNIHQAIELADRSIILESGSVALRGGKELLKDDYVREVYLGL